MSSIVIQGDTSGSITVEAPSVAGTHTLTLPKATGNIATDATVGLGMKNRVINGNMVIDQRNAGASVSTTPTDAIYTLDRWMAAFSTANRYTVQQNAGSVTPPTGFTNYLGVTSLAATSVGSSDYYFLQQIIEGFNVADLAWGTANAKTITLSFWVRSSLTGTFGGALTNGGQNRSYPFSYTISSANTWEQKTITIAGDTSGTWLTNNGAGIRLRIDLGVGSTFSGTAGSWAGANYFSATGATSVVGTSGATFYITGVQLEVGENATPFENRMYGTELALCQRYYQQISGNSFGGSALYAIFGNGFAFNTTQADIFVPLKVTMRATPTITRSADAIQVLSTNYSVTGVADVGSTFNMMFLRISTAGTFTAGYGALWSAYNNASAYAAFSAEL